MVKSSVTSGASTGSRTKLTITALITLAVLALIAALVIWWFTHNYAQDAAKPLETVLANGGAVKICGSGDPGRGPDNYAPNYAAQYELTGSKDDAVKLITRAAANNGYTLSHQRSPYPYIDFYVDSTGKPSVYPGFSNGSVTLRFSVYGAGEKKLYCGSQPLRSDATHTAISLGVELPSSE